MNLAITVFGYVFWVGLGVFVAMVALVIVAGVIMGTVNFLTDYLEKKL